MIRKHTVEVHRCCCTRGMKIVLFFLFFFPKLTTQSFLFPKENLTAADSYCSLHLEVVDSAGHFMSRLVCARCLWLRTLNFVFISIRMERSICGAAFLLHVFNFETGDKSCLGFLLWCKMHQTSKANKQSLSNASIGETKEKLTLCFMENRAENLVPRTELTANT